MSSSSASPGYPVLDASFSKLYLSLSLRQLLSHSEPNSYEHAQLMCNHAQSVQTSGMKSFTLKSSMECDIMLKSRAKKKNIA